jgi:hypothetical protein
MRERDRGAELSEAHLPRDGACPAAMLDLEVLSVSFLLTSRAGTQLGSAGALTGSFLRARLRDVRMTVVLTD